MSLMYLTIMSIFNWILLYWPVYWGRGNLSDWTLRTKWGISERLGSFKLNWWSASRHPFTQLSNVGQNKIKFSTTQSLWRSRRYKMRWSILIWTQFSIFVETNHHTPIRKHVSSVQIVYSNNYTVCADIFQNWSGHAKTFAQVQGSLDKHREIWQDKQQGCTKSKAVNRDETQM